MEAVLIVVVVDAPVPGFVPLSVFMTMVATALSLIHGVCAA